MRPYDDLFAAKVDELENRSCCLGAKLNLDMSFVPAKHPYQEYDWIDL